MILLHSKNAEKKYLKKGFNLTNLFLFFFNNLFFHLLISLILSIKLTKEIGSIYINPEIDFKDLGRIIIFGKEKKSGKKLVFSNIKNIEDSLPFDKFSDFSVKVF